MRLTSFESVNGQNNQTRRLMDSNVNVNVDPSGNPQAAPRSLVFHSFITILLHVHNVNVVLKRTSVVVVFVGFVFVVVYRTIIVAFHLVQTNKRKLLVDDTQRMSVRLP